MEEQPETRQVKKKLPPSDKAISNTGQKSRPSIRRSAIPVGTQFSPGVVHLPNFLRALVEKSGDKASIEDAIWQSSVRLKPPSKPLTRRLKSLPVEAAVQYGLLDPDYRATDLCARLSGMGDSELYEEFARHILLRRGGLRVLEGIAQMEADNLIVTGDSLAQFLSDQGFAVTVHNTAINSLRMWLAKAGLFSAEGASAWKANRGRLEELLQLSDEQIGILAALKPPVRAFVRALCRANPPGEVLASAIRDAAEAREHIRIGRSSLPNEVLRPLKAAGLIEFSTGGTSSGKSSKLTLTPAFRRDILEAFVTETVKDLDAAVSDYYRRRPGDIFADLESTDTFVKGRALEAFSILLMRQLGLRFIGWNKRAADTTAQAEVDVVLGGIIGAVQTRWQIQCKNTPSKNIDLESVAKEVGLLPVTQATHVLIIGNTGFTEDAIVYANEIMRRTPYTIFLLDKTDFEVIKKDPNRLLSILRHKSESIGRLQTSAALFGSA
jgi:hypothetical protein